MQGFHGQGVAEGVVPQVGGIARVNAKDMGTGTPGPSSDQRASDSL